MGARGRKERNAFPSSLLPRAWSRALIPFPFPFESLPRRLSAPKFRGRKRNLSWCVYVLRKTSHEGMPRRSRAATTKKVRKVCCTYKVVVLLIKPITFLTFSSPSSSSHLNVPFLGKEDGNNIRVVLITLKLFLFCRKIGKRVLMTETPQNQNPKKKVRMRLKQEMIMMVMITMRMMWNLRRKVKCINSRECRHTTLCNCVLQNKIVVILVLMLALFCLLCSFFTLREKEIH